MEEQQALRRILLMQQHAAAFTIDALAMSTHQVRRCAYVKRAPLLATNRAVLAWHAAAAKAHREKLEREASQRMALLKEKDFDAYLEAVQRQSSRHVEALLADTDACLRKILARLGAQNRAATGALSGCAGGGGVRASAASWDALSKLIPAELPQQPAGLRGIQLHDYQMHGLRWMLGLHDLGLNGILADDMGLGKTAQIIALITLLVEQRGEAGRYLIVAPASVLTHWLDEIARFSPRLRVAAYRGTYDERTDTYEREIRRAGGANVVVTSYEFLINKRDAPRMAALRWHYVILDEGHRVKNADCALARALRGYRVRHKLLLSGTPVQNALNELWALLNFLLPDMFGSAEEFDAWFGSRLAAGGVDVDGGCGGASEVLRQEQVLIVTNRLHQVLRPFLLRRTKAILAAALPPKIERAVACPASAYQTAMLALLRAKGAAVAHGGGGGGVQGVNNVIMEMRKVCNDPVTSRLHVPGADEALADHCTPASVQLGGKMAALTTILRRLVPAGHKLLLFSTMTTQLDSAEEVLEWLGVRFERLDGNTRACDRAAALAAFSCSPNVAVMLLSLRAGGVGLNLQAADTVVFLDTDWNPQIDLQAQARAHRLGQTRTVLVLRLYVPATIEEHVIATAGRKRVLADAAITGGFFDGSTDSEERHKFMVQLLEATEPAPEAAGAIPDASQMDALLARSAEELRRFRASPMPAMLEHLAPAVQCRAMIEEMQAANTAKAPVEEALGRGVRRR